MFSATTYNESGNSSFTRGSPKTLYHNFLVPKKNMDGNFLFQVFKTQNNTKIAKNFEAQKRQYNPPSRLRHRSTLNSFSQQKTIKTRSQSSQGKQFQSKNKNQLKNYIQFKGQSKHIKTTQDTFIFKKSVDLRDPFFGFENPQNFQKIIFTKKRFYHNRSPAIINSLDKDQYSQKLKQQTENSGDCRGHKCKLLQNYLSEIKRNRDDLVKKKNTISRIKKRISVNNKVVKKKTIDQFLPKLNVFKNDKHDNLDIKEMQKQQQLNTIFSNITSKSLCVLKDDLIIYGKNEDQKRQIASLTKVMTCIAGLFLIQKFQLIWQTALVKVSREAVLLGGTTANLKPGDDIILKDLFYGMMLPSGNDAAYTIGQYFGRMLHLEENNQRKIQNSIRSKTPVQYTDPNKKVASISSKQAMNYFIRQMNKISEYLSLSNTSFTNCHGLSDSLNYSTSYDIAVLSYYCIQNLKFQQIIATKQYQSKIYNKNAKLGRTQKWTNTNLLLHNNQKLESFGGKTGYTSTAGPCLMTCFKNEQKIMIIVLLSCETKEARFKQAQEIFHKLKQFKCKYKVFKKSPNKSQNETKSSEIFQLEML